MSPIHISDAETDRLVRSLASKRRLSITEAIKIAVKNELQKDRPEPQSSDEESNEGLNEALEADLDSLIRVTTLEYTRLLARERGTKGVGSRVYQMLARYGAVGTLRRLVDRPTEGLEFLKSIDRIELSAEKIALDPKFTTLIDDKLRESARTNLQRIGA